MQTQSQDPTSILSLRAEQEIRLQRRRRRKQGSNLQPFITTGHDTRRPQHDHSSRQHSRRSTLNPARPNNLQRSYVTTEQRSRDHAPASRHCHWYCFQQLLSWSEHNDMAVNFQGPSSLVTNFFTNPKFY